MATPAMTPLANITLTGSASSVNISNISQNYRDLVLKVSMLASANSQINLVFNNNNTNQYNFVCAFGNGTSAGTNGYFATQGVIQTNYGYNADTRFELEANIFDYSTNDKHIPVLGRLNGPTAGTLMFAARYQLPSPITSINIASAFIAGSTVSLYGVIA